MSNFIVLLFSEPVPKKKGIFITGIYLLLDDYKIEEIHTVFMLP